jgi:hypothetical protein
MLPTEILEAETVAVFHIVQSEAGQISLLEPLYGIISLVAEDQLPFIAVSWAFFAFANTLSIVRKPCTLQLANLILK